MDPSEWDWSRPIIDHGYCAAYLLDPDGTNVEAVHRGLAAMG